MCGRCLSRALERPSELSYDVSVSHLVGRNSCRAIDERLLLQRKVDGKHDIKLNFGLDGVGELPFH